MDEPRRGRGSLRRVVAWSVTAAIVAVAAIAGTIWGGSGWRWVDRHLLSDRSTTSTPLPPRPTAPSPLAPSPSAGASASGATPAARPTVLGPAGAAPLAPLPTSDTDKAAAARITAALNKVSRTGLGTVSGYVLDPTTGAVLYNNGGGTPMLPASTNKVLTTTAALSAMGPWKTFSTTVVSPARGQVVLVGGGDPYLVSGPNNDYPAKPTLAQLAHDTASALKAQRTTSVTLGYDDSLFTGPSWNSTWPASYKDQLSMPSALMVDEGAATRNQGARATPAASAAGVFAQLLKANGITVGGHVDRVLGKARSARLASVQSLPLATIVQQTLMHSDNTAAEMLLRQVALATGQPASFTGGVAAVRARLTALGVWDARSSLADGSGLSRSDHVSAQMLARTLRTVVTTDTLRPLLDGLPVAGVTGTLWDRFTAPTALPGRGIVHTKTGTLTHVSSYAGITTTAKGAPVVFAFLVNGASPTANVTAKTPGTNDWLMRQYLDVLATTLASS